MDKDLITRNRRATFYKYTILMLFVFVFLVLSECHVDFNYVF